MDNTVLKTLQKAELEIVKDVSGLCEKNNLQYFIVGGTLLGAIRHKGFIPWDDDLDIAMPRKDYNKLIELMSKKSGGKYFIHCQKTDKNYWLPFAKVRKNGTVFNEQNISNLITHKGIYIDIFPLDNANKQKSLFQNFQAHLTRAIDGIIIHRRLKRSNDNLSLKMKIFKFIFSIFSIKTLSKFRDKIMTLNKNENSKFIINLGSNYHHIKQTIPRDKYYPSTKVEFEGVLLSAPGDYKYVLKSIYGDYMALPPEEKRVNHNAVEIYFGEEDRR